MKHLKSFNESNWISNNKSLIEHVGENILKDIEDICLELEEEGFLFEIQRISYGGEVDKPEIEILIWRPGKTFKFDEVSETLLRLTDYMHGNGFKTNIRINHDLIKVKKTIFGNKFYFPISSLTKVKSYADRIRSTNIHFIKK